MSMSVSVTEFSKVLPPFFPPPTFSSVRVGGLAGRVGGLRWWWVVVVVLIVVPKLLLHPLLSSLFL